MRKKATQLKMITNSLTKKIDFQIFDDVLVIIPCFNEEQNIKKTVESLLEVYPFNYLIVNDCSTDNTLKILEENKFNYISNPTNLKLSNTFREGVKWAVKKGYKYVVQFDGDGQHNAADIPEMISLAAKGYDIVITSRYYSNHNIDKNKVYAHKLLRWCFKFRTGQIITDPTCGLRLYNWSVMEEYVSNKKLEVEPSTITYLIAKKKFKMKEIGTTVFVRENGESIFNNKSHIIRYMSKQLFYTLFIELLFNKGK
ncbi:MAG: glycosyltransferase family 2 protein [Mycoplasma sp.]